MPWARPLLVLHRMGVETQIGKTIRIAAVGDLHCTRRSVGMLRPLLELMAHSADILVLCGDLTDYGTVEEAQVLAAELAGAGKTPLVGVLGNHDVESGKGAEVTAILRDAGLEILDGGAVELLGIGFAGTKGFAGGFQRHSLEPWGEPVVKAFVREAMEEAMKLESSLAKLETPRKIAVLHYSPVRATVEGEPVEIIPFLGSRRLEEPLLRYPVSAVFHGHAHFGAPEGVTAGGIPVYNVAMPLLRRRFPEVPPFRVVTLDGNGLRPDARCGASGPGDFFPLSG